MHNATVVGINLSKVDLTNTALTNIDSFEGAILRRTIFPHRIRLQGMVFLKADLTYADLRNAYLDDANFSGANLYGAKFDYASMRRATFRNAKAAEASMLGTDLRDAVFANTDIDEVIFHKANLLGASFKNLVRPRSAEFLGTTCPDGVVSDACYEENRLRE